MVWNLHILGRELACWGDFISVLNRISARHLKNTVFPSKSVVWKSKMTVFNIYTTFFDGFNMFFRFLAEIRLRTIIKSPQKASSRPKMCKFRTTCTLPWATVCVLNTHMYFLLLEQNRKKLCDICSAKPSLKAYWSTCMWLPAWIPNFPICISCKAQLSAEHDPKSIVRKM